MKSKRDWMTNIF